jgi:hypothetical protein
MARKLQPGWGSPATGSTPDAKSIFKKPLPPYFLNTATDTSSQSNTQRLSDFQAACWGILPEKAQPDVNCFSICYFDNK